MALSDERKIIATPLCTLENFSSLNEAALLLKEKVNTYNTIDTIVIGLPLHMSGEESELATLTRKFAGLLKEVFALPVIFWDERLTSMQVERTMREGGLSRKKQSKLVDKLAAAAILQNYLDSQI